MNEDKLNREQRAARAASRAGEQVARRVDTFYKARHGIAVRLTREEERAALARCK